MSIFSNKIKIVLLFCFGLFTYGLSASESNFWPLWHQQPADEFGRDNSANFLIPFGGRTEQKNQIIHSFRPLVTDFNSDYDPDDHWHILYPLLNYYESSNGYNWHLLNLVRWHRIDPLDYTSIDVFPFLFSRQSKLKHKNYFALWPAGGTLKNRLWKDRIDFALWPLWVRTENNGDIYHHFPYPFLRRLSGEKSKGFGIWPLYGQFEKEGEYFHQWVLWPFYYNYKDKLHESEPYQRFGLWPFYHRETAEGLRSHSFIWPFFGHTKTYEPREQYRETRYFWPFVVQGRGASKYINRLLPLYAKEEMPNKKKTWYLWPLFKKEYENRDGLEVDRTSLFYFLYKDELQSFTGKSARKSHLWPLASYWRSSDGQVQFQALDPFTVFFPRNEKIKENWTPLFALYRYDSRWGSVRHSLFWNLVVLKYGDRETLFQIGPFFELSKNNAEYHVELLSGLLGGGSYSNGDHFKLMWMSF